MVARFSRRAFLSGALAGLTAGSALADAPGQSLRPVLRPGGIAATAKVASKSSVPPAAALIEAAQLGGRVSFAVVDTRTGQMLEGHDAGLSHPPASVSKAVTALYALDVLGPKHRFLTRLVATGPIHNGVLKGDLVLAGGGDPTLDTNALADMATQLKAAGVREITGGFHVWGGALPLVRAIDRTQPDHAGYNPAISGLSLNYNRVYFEWKRGSNGWQVSMDARSDRYRPDVRVARMQIVNRSTPVYTYAEKNGVDHWTVADGALGNGGARWLPVRQPEMYAGEVLRGFARSHGIVLPEPRKRGNLPGGTMVARHVSPELAIILRDMLKYSNNLTAEMVGMTATAKRKGRVGGLGDSAGEMSRWAKETLGMTRTALVDHSGLSDKSQMTAQDMALALARAHRSAALKPMLKPFAMRDENGRVNKAHPIKVQAKTGTLYFVSGLAGYASPPGRGDLAFAILAADVGRRGRSNSDARPPGARGWNARAKTLQQKLIERWATLYGT